MPPKRYIRVLTPAPVTVTLFGSRVFEDVIRLRLDDWCPYIIRWGESAPRHMQRECDVKTEAGTAVIYPQGPFGPFSLWCFIIAAAIEN